MSVLTFSDVSRWKGFAAILIVWFTLNHVLWLILDHAPPQSDSVYYLQGSYRFLDAIHTKGGASLATISNLVPHRPPLLSLMGASITPVTGRTPDHLPLMNPLWLALAAWFVFAFARRLAGEPAGFFAALFLLTNPFVFPYLSDFETELPLMAVLAGSFLWMVRILEKPLRRDFFILGFWIMAGLLLKWLYAVIVAGPIIYILIVYYRNMQPGNSRLTRFGQSLICMLILPTMLALPWYIHHASDLWRYQKEVAELGYFTPFTDGWSWRVLIYYPLLLALKIKWVHSFGMGVGAGFSLLAFRRKESAHLHRYFILLWLALLIPWLYFIVNDRNLAEKYLLPIQPLLAVMAAVSCRWVSRRWNFLYGAIGLAFLLIATHAQWGILPFASPEKQFSSFWLKAQTGFLSYESHPPCTQPFPHATLADSIAEASPTTRHPLRVTSIPVLDSFSAFTFSPWLNAKIPQAESLDGSPYRVILNLLFHEFLITSRGKAYHAIEHRDRINSILPEIVMDVSKWLDSSPANFQETHRLRQFSDDSYDGTVLQLYERIRPVQVEEASGIIGLFVERLDESDFLWEQIDITWRRLREPLHEKRAKEFSEALFYGGEQITEQLIAGYRKNHADWLPYEKYMLAVLASRFHDIRTARDALRSILEKSASCRDAAERLFLQLEKR